MPVVLHAKNITYPACTDPDRVGPQDWNSTHLNYLTLDGNTLGASTLSGSNLILSGGANITLSVNGQSLGIIGPTPVGLAISASDSLWSSGTVTLVGSQNITVGTQPGSIVLTGPDLTPFLTTAAVSNHSHGNPSLALTNLTGTTASNSAGLTLSLSAAAGGVAISASNSLWSSGTVTLTGSQNITVGTAAGQIVITGPDLTPFLTTAAQVSHSHGNPSLALTNLTGTTASNSAGLTLSLSAAAPGAGGGVAISASNSLWSSGTVTLTGSRNITVGTAAGQIVITGPDLAAYLTTAAQVSHSHGNPSLALTNLTGTTASNSAGLTVSLSAAAPGGGGVALSAGTQLATSGTVVFSNSNNISFGLSGSTRITASAEAALPTHSHGNPSLALTNLSGTTASNSGGLTLSLSAAAGGAGGTHTFSVDGLSSITGTAVQVVFSAGPNVTLQQTTAAGAMTLGISVAAPGGGAGYTKSIKFLHEDLIGFNTGSVVTSEGTQYIWMPLHMDNAISISQVMMLKSMSALTISSSNSSGRQSLSYNMTLYVFRRSDFAANSASLTFQTSASGGLSVSRSHTSNQNSISIAWVTNSTGGTSSFSTTGTGSAWVTALTGPRFFMVPLVTSLSQGEWFLARRHSSTTGGAGYASNSNPLTISAIAFTLQSGLAMVMPIGSSGSNLSNPFHAIGFGSATAITTNAVMNATVISAGSTALRVPFGVMVNMPWKA